MGRRFGHMPRRWYVTGRVAATPGFNPNSIPGLAAWMDASDVSTVTLDGSNNVSALTNKGALGSWAQGDSLRRMNYITAAQNGLNAIRCTNSGVLWMDNTQSSAESYFGAGRNVCTQFCVWKYTANAIAQRVFIGLDTNRVQRTNSNNLTTVWNGSSYNPTNFSASTAWRCLVSRFDGPNSKHDSWAGLTKVATQTDFTGFSMASSSAYRCRFGNDGVTADADFGEFLHYNTVLSDSDVTLVTNYLLAKWGL